MTETNRNPATPWVIAAVTLIVCIELVGALLLSLHNTDATRFISACTIITAVVVPSLFTIVKIGTVETKVDEAKATAAETVENTNTLLNGGLTERVRKAVHTALDERGIPGGPE